MDPGKLALSSRREQHHCECSHAAFLWHVFAFFLVLCLHLGHYYLQKKKKKDAGKHLPMTKDLVEFENGIHRP